MYAVIKTGGKQYKVAAGDKLKVEKLSGDVGSNVTFDQVLMVADGDNVTIGAPLVSGATVPATIISHGRGDWALGWGLVGLCLLIAGCAALFGTWWHQNRVLNAPDEHHH